MEKIIIERKYFEIISTIIDWFLKEYCGIENCELNCNTEERFPCHRICLLRIRNKWHEDREAVSKCEKEFEIEKRWVYYLKDATEDAANYYEELSIDKECLREFRDYLKDICYPDER